MKVLVGACAETIAAFHGSQCGFCTPGMVVACHTALTKARECGGEPAPEAMEKALDGNLCRCTGYRPILDACKVPPVVPLTSHPDIRSYALSSCTGCWDCRTLTCKARTCAHCCRLWVGKTSF